ncbi:VWA domain-containing protein [Nocardioides zeae]|uniref:VWA domain-containing protein n=1 Tax=Nocardioides imazamoxiresistens TaxID=3231893 RepID=A0ABU3PW15_9ACTN|nr:VWA domain-containing protein [Nocardioides zeae]MDT9593426.1 VWA domain-containing protein [Nocardioides zeae]
MATGGLLTRHLALVEALRGAGLPVSLAEGLDAVGAVGRVGWADRETVRAAYAATLVKRAGHRTTFDTLFDVYFPPLVGEGLRTLDPTVDDPTAGRATDPGRDSAAELQSARDDLVATLTELLQDGQEGRDGLPGDSADALRRLATEVVGRFGAMPGRQPGQTAFSAYQTLRRLAPAELTDRLVAGLLGDLDEAAMEPGARERTQRRAARGIGRFTGLVEDDARRRIAERKSPAYVAEVAVRPSIDRVAFTAARREDLEEMRRQVGPLARRLATRLAKQRHAQGRGPLDFRRTVRASMSTGGVPVQLRRRPRRPHRTDLVVLCDVSGSVAHFAQFTLLLTYALREHFGRLRAFTFVDRTTEVTDLLRPGRDPVEVMESLSSSIRHAALTGRTSYGGAFRSFREQYADALGPASSLLVLGDARSNFTDLALADLRAMTDGIRASWWLNPEHPRQWDTGDSAASRYAAVVPMVECRNLTQLEEFVQRVL